MNSSVERALRQAVCWRKASGGTDGRFVRRVLTVAASCCQQNRVVLAVLTDVVQSARTGATPPSLVPAGKRTLTSEHRHRADAESERTVAAANCAAPDEDAP